MADGYRPEGNVWPGEPELPPLPADPLVTVIVPSYNQGRFIGQTIASILGQSYRKLEVLVMDGASKDETLPVLQAFASDARLRVISEPDKGVADAVNKGFALARGAVLAIQSSDDVYLPDAIAIAVERLGRADTPGLVYGEIDKVDADGQLLAKPRTGEYSLENWLSKSTYIPQPATFFRRELLQAAGQWNPEFFNCDTEFWLRAIWCAPVRKIDRELSMRRMHGEQRDNQKRRIVESYSRMIDSAPQIHGLPRKLRRAARAGKWLHHVRYDAGGSRLSATGYLWLAVLSYPRLLRTLPARYRLLPFGSELLSLAGRVRRRLGIPRFW